VLHRFQGSASIVIGVDGEQFAGRVGKLEI
jgi:hypothetical protein